MIPPQFKKGIRISSMLAAEFLAEVDYFDPSKLVQNASYALARVRVSKHVLKVPCFSKQCTHATKCK